MAAQAGADSFDDDDFDDDIFDNLPNSTIQTLETRRPTVKQHVVPPGNSQVVGALSSFRAEPIRPSLSILNNFSGPKRTTTSSKFVNDTRSVGAEEEVINLDNYSLAGQTGFQNGLRGGSHNAAWSRQQSNGSSIQVPHRPVKSGETFSQASQVQPARLDTDALQVKILQLEREKDHFKQAAESAEAKFQAKTGEAAILRQRIEKTAHEYEQRLETLKQSHLESNARQRAELDAVQKEREKAETDKRFLEHDLTAESKRNRHLQKVVPAIARSRTIPDDLRKAAISPRKQRQYSLGDGFDDDVAPPPTPSKTRPEASHSFDTFQDDNAIQFPASPAKSWAGSKQATPSRRPEKKRKRANQTPVGQRTLDLVGDASGGSHALPFSPDPFFSRRGGRTNISHASQRQATFLNSLMTYKPPHATIGFFDAMAGMTLSSVSDTVFSRYIIDRWAVNTRPADKLIPEFCFIICELWEMCIDGLFYQAYDSLADVLHFVVSRNGAHLSQNIVSKILPPAIKTVNLVAFPIASDTTEADEEIPQGKVNSRVVLELLLAIARDCESSKEAITTFWSTMDLHWTLVLLYVTQPHYHITLMCSLLRTSIFEDSFGPIYSDSEFNSVNDQDDIEQILIDRLTSLLSSSPRPLDPHEKLGQIDKLAFHMEIIDTLYQLSMPPRSSLAIAKHPKAIGRLIQFLHRSVDILYQPCNMVTQVHDLAVSHINIGMHLLYAILTENADEVDIRDKLKSIDGGMHSHLIVLTRIAFCESIVLERGIEPAVSDAAHMLLDEFLSPIEGEQLLRMFPSSDGTVLRIKSRSPEREDKEMKNNKTGKQRVNHAENMDLS